MEFIDVCIVCGEEKETINIWQLDGKPTCVDCRSDLFVKGTKANEIWLTLWHGNNDGE
jgi:DNA-directed RNA polymerase subunit RPC12/RpoP